MYAERVYTLAICGTIVTSAIALAFVTSHVCARSVKHEMDKIIPSVIESLTIEFHNAVVNTFPELLMPPSPVSSSLSVDSSWNMAACFDAWKGLRPCPAVPPRETR